MLQREWKENGKVESCSLQVVAENMKWRKWRKWLESGMYGDTVQAA